MGEASSRDSGHPSGLGMLIDRLISSFRLLREWDAPPLVFLPLSLVVNCYFSALPVPVTASLHL